MCVCVCVLELNVMSGCGIAHARMRRNLRRDVQKTQHGKEGWSAARRARLRAVASAVSSPSSPSSSSSSSSSSQERKIAKRLGGGGGSGYAAHELEFVVGVPDMNPRPAVVYPPARAGDVVTGIVVATSPDGSAEVEVQGMGRARAEKDMSGAHDEGHFMELGLGSTHEFEVLGVSPSNMPILRTMSAKKDVRCHRAQQLSDQQVYVQLTIESSSPASLVGTVEGLKAFIPRVEHDKRLKAVASHIGMTYSVIITKVIHEGSGSVRCSLVAARKKRRKQMKTGTLVRGVVIKIEPYGIFVREEISDVRMLLHHSQVSWVRGLNVQSLVDIGDEVYAMIGTVENHKFDCTDSVGGLRCVLNTETIYMCTRTVTEKC